MLWLKLNYVSKRGQRKLNTKPIRHVHLKLPFSIRIKPIYKFRNEFLRNIFAIQNYSISKQPVTICFCNIVKRVYTDITFEIKYIIPNV